MRTTILNGFIWGYVYLSMIIGIPHSSFATAQSQVIIAESIPYSELERLIGKTQIARLSSNVVTLREENNALMISKNNSIIALYREEGNSDVRLSQFDQVKENILWQSALAPSGLVPRPFLAEIQFDQNDISDILLSVSYDRGVSNSVENYEQYITLFLNEQDEIEPPILLSASDWAHAGEEGSTGNEDVYLDNGKGQPGFERRSLVMILPSSRTPGTIIVWSQIETFEHPPTKTPGTVVFRVETYELQNMTMIAKTSTSGSYQDTVALLRSLISARQSLGEEPLLFDFSSPTPIKTPEKWFRKWGIPE